MIKKLKIIDLDNACKIFHSVINKMKSQGIDQWDDIYPAMNILKEDILSESAFGYFIDGKPIAYIALNTRFDKEYNDVKWSLNHENSLVVHRLAIHSDFQNQGIGKKLMKFAEEYAVKNKYSGIRFDAFSKNPQALYLYKSLGYQEAGFVTFRKGKFIVFEKALSLL